MRAIYITLMTFCLVSCPVSSVNTKEEQIASVTEAPKLTEWEILIQALIQVESSGDSLAVGKTNDLGALQLTPIYVADVNRIVGDEVYLLQDRLSQSKSVEMFNILQDHYNPDHDIKKAIKLHNPKAGDWYYDRVCSVMDALQGNFLY